MNINVWTFSGRLTRTPILRVVGDKNVCNFSVAINEYAGKDKENSALFVECNVWGGQAAYLAKFDKGDEITVTGQVTQRLWQTKEGVERITLGCRVNNYHIHATPGEIAVDEEEKPKEPEKQRARVKPVAKAVVETEDEDEEDIPF